MIWWTSRIRPGRAKLAQGCRAVQNGAGTGAELRGRRAAGPQGRNRSPARRSDGSQGPPESPSRRSAKAWFRIWSGPGGSSRKTVPPLPSAARKFRKTWSGSKRRRRSSRQAETEIQRLLRQHQELQAQVEEKKEALLSEREKLARVEEKEKERRQASESAPRTEKRPLPEEHGTRPQPKASSFLRRGEIPDPGGSLLLPGGFPGLFRPGDRGPAGRAERPHRGDGRGQSPGHSGV